MCEARILQREKSVHCPKPNFRKNWAATFCKLMSRGKTQLVMKLLADPLHDFKVLSHSDTFEGKTVKLKLIELHPSGSFVNDTAILKDHVANEDSYMVVNDPEPGTSCKGESVCCLHCAYSSIAVSMKLLKAYLHFEGVSVGMHFGCSSSKFDSCHFKQ
ncbi:hypothetical protein GJ496_009264 [Pomphorhynchus laevis]|nr:hypothetical protein GJ496_009264 [Pomphorhynchus laevis]